MAFVARSRVAALNAPTVPYSSARFLYHDLHLFGNHVETGGKIMQRRASFQSYQSSIHA